MSIKLHSQHSIVVVNDINASGICIIRLYEPVSKDEGIEESNKCDIDIADCHEVSEDDVSEDPGGFQDSFNVGGHFKILFCF